MGSKCLTAVKRVHSACALSYLTLCAVALSSCSHGLQSWPLPASLTDSSSPQRGPSSGKYQVLFDFGSSVNGYYGIYPEAPLINVNGTLYGTTASGGSHGYNGRWGTVFSVTPAGALTVLHTFSNNDGQFPLAGLIDVKGTLYGTTSAGGVHSSGTVFGVGLGGQNFRVLHTFTGGADGAYPMAGLVAVDGKLYGTTYQGGTSNEGTVFSVRVTDGKEHVLHSFSNNPDGAYPLAGLISVKGLLYGTTQQGGRSAGTAFSITRAGEEKVLYSFTGSDGAFPHASLLAAKGALYGTTGGGGSAQSGTVFSMSTTGTEERVLYSFGGSASDGVGPVASLIIVNGKLYGTTFEGGVAGAGTVFRVGLTGKERILHSFAASYQDDGIIPQAGLVALNGKLYGTTYQGGISLPSCDYYGACAYGTVFALTP